MANFASGPTASTERHTLQRSDRGALPALALGLAGLLVAVKMLLLPFPVHSAGEFIRWLLRLSLVVAADLCFVAALTAACALVSLVTSRWRRACALWRLTMFALFYLAGLYGVLSYSMYSITLVPFSVRLLSFAGGPLLMSDSIAKYVTWQMVLALVAGPVMVLLLPRLMRRAPRLQLPPFWQWTAATAGCLAIPLYGAASHAYIESHWPEPSKWERRIAQSPHTVLLASCLDVAFSREDFTTNLLAGDVDESDFLPPARDAATQEATGSADPLPHSRPKNVVVILLESAGAEYLSLHGRPYDTTPHLQRLAAEKGVMFENLYVSVPNSCKSLISLTSGVYPALDWRLIVRDCPQFNVPSIQQILAEKGYRTCFAHSGYWSWQKRDVFLRERGAQTLIDAETMPQHRINSWGVSDKAMFQAALEWIDAAPDEPFFLLAYTIETHHPYARPDRPLKFDVDDPELNDYLNALRVTDERIGWFMEELRRRNLEESTLVAITTDHGESFGQHNQREHMFGIYQPNVHIPLVLLHPSLARFPRRMSAVREQIDIAPTLLELLGHQPPPQWQGRSLFRTDDDRPAYFFCVGNHVVLGLRDGPWKYHYYLDSGQEELFHVADDPDEQHNLAGEHAARCLGYRRKVGGLLRFQRRYLAHHGA